MKFTARTTTSTESSQCSLWENDFEFKKFCMFYIFCKLRTGFHEYAYISNLWFFILYLITKAWILYN